MKQRLYPYHKAESVEEALGVDPGVVKDLIMRAANRKLKVSEAIEYIWSQSPSLNAALLGIFTLGTSQGLAFRMKQAEDAAKKAS
jgi:hypothetical protein